MLTVVLGFKIMLTATLWAAPLLLFPAPWLVYLGLPVDEPQLPLVRLLGVAYAALLVTYANGLWQTRKGRYPHEAVLTGIASNGGACLVLGSVAIGDGWSTWGAPARWLMWASLVATGVITVALIACARAESQRHSGSPD